MTTPASNATDASVSSYRRVVLLGASNVALGFPILVETARRLLGGPLDLLAAFGHGRSYGVAMSLLGRGLPGIEECGLWPALAKRPPAPTVALVTDVGNDVLYDFPVPDIAAWVEMCLDRLHRAGAQIILTGLPLCNLPRLSPRRFLLMRTVLFPGCRLTLTQVRDRALDLNDRLQALARRLGVTFVEPRARWYGLDPIHIAREQRPRAWREIFALWPGVRPAEPAWLGLPHALRLWLLAPERRWLLGWERRTPQPAGRLADRTTLSLY